jgi:hypothetical protein
MPPLRSALLLCVLAFGWCPAAQSPAIPQESFRFRQETVDALFERAKAARAARTLPESAYLPVLELLAAQEKTIQDEARVFPFSDITESNYWHRGRLKFPSSLKTELQLLRQNPVPR